MLIRFSVENYKSFKERQVFSMAAGKQTRHPSHCLTINGKRLLKSSFFFGANASGKSNFVHALDFMRKIVLQGTKEIRYGDSYFRIDPKWKDKPGVFQVDFMQNCKIYQYGFAISYYSRKIHAEWLYRIDSSDKEICIFERNAENKIESSLILSSNAKLRYKIYAEDLNDDELFLREICSKNLKDDKGFADFFDTFLWFTNIEVIYPSSHVLNQEKFLFQTGSESADSLADLFRYFDTGIKGIKKKKLPVERAFAFLPDEVRKNLLDDLSQKMISGNGRLVRVAFEESQFDVFMEKDHMVAEKIMLDHGNSEDLFEMSDESDGTKRLFDLLPIYKLSQTEKVIIIDELDRSLHSKLTEQYIDLYFKYTEGKRSQIICTTHDTNIMNLRLLRQDEIWFVERGLDQASKLYSLSDFKERFDKNILNDYLLGRYGAIPCFNDNDLPGDEK